MVICLGGHLFVRVVPQQRDTDGFCVPPVRLAPEQWHVHMPSGPQHSHLYPHEQRQRSNQMRASKQPPLTMVNSFFLVFARSLTSLFGRYTMTAGKKTDKNPPTFWAEFPEENSGAISPLRCRRRSNHLIVAHPVHPTRTTDSRGLRAGT